MKMSKKMASAIVASAMALIVLIAGGTYAYFSDIISVENNSFQTGTLKLTSARNDMPIQGPMFYTEDSVESGIRGTGYWHPGKEVSRMLLVENEGSLNARLKSVKANVTSTNASSTELTKFAKAMNITVYVARNQNTSNKSAEKLKEALEAGQVKFEAWLKANDATEDGILAKMEQIYNEELVGRGLPPGWAMESSTLEKYRTGVNGGFNSNGTPRVPLASGETIALSYSAHWRHGTDKNENELQGKVFNIEFVHDFVQADYK